MKSFKTSEGLEFPLVQLQGKDYLNVCYRVAWFRHKHEFGEIFTERLSDDGKLVTYRARVSTSDKLVLSTAEKTTYIKAPTDYEKCETGAVGRALSFAGFGTAQGDIDEGDLVDAPIEPKTKDSYYIDYNNFKGKPELFNEPSPFDNEDPHEERIANLKKFNETPYVPASDEGNKTFVGTKFAGDTFQKVYDNKRTAAIEYVDVFIPTLTEPSEQLRRFKQYVDWRRSQEKSGQKIADK